MSGLGLVEGVALGLLLAGLALLGLGLRQLRRRRPLRAGVEGLGGGGLLAVGLAVGAAALNLHTYQRLTAERPLAELHFQALAPQRYHVLLEKPGSDAGSIYELQGDQWQLEGRLLKWTGPATLLGLDPRFRLERLQGRYADANQARVRRPSVHDLTPPQGLDLGRLAHSYSGWLPLVDALYGTATYLPMADGARFAVAVGAQGLIARPLNREAEKAVEGWR